MESDHGRYGGNSLDDQGAATPGIFGPRLDGRPGTREIRDTDAGELDGDQRFDRAVGPMQFIPSTWSVVGVDADGDGVRNPQDVDDAALASAVYLCAGAGRPGHGGGQRSAVFRYNHSREYVDLVLRSWAAYLQGDYTAVPNSTLAGGYLTPTFTPSYGELGLQQRHVRLLAAAQERRRQRLASGSGTVESPGTGGSTGTVDSPGDTGRAGPLRSTGTPAPVAAFRAPATTRSTTPSRTPRTRSTTS